MTVDRLKVATARRSRHSMVAYRNQAPGYHPRTGRALAKAHGSTEGASTRLRVPRAVPVRDAALRAGGAGKAGREASGRREGLLARELYRYELDLDQVLDVTQPAVREHIGVSIDELTGDDWAICQAIGIEAHAGAIKRSGHSQPRGSIKSWWSFLKQSVLVLRRWTWPNDGTRWVICRISLPHVDSASPRLNTGAGTSRYPSGCCAPSGRGPIRASTVSMMIMVELPPWLESP